MNTPDSLLSALSWRYAVKKFDPAQIIPEKTWNALEEALVLTPSSYGLQPWKFFIVTDKSLREKMVPVSWNQKQVVDCSHFVVFAIKKNITENDVRHFMQRTSEVRGTPLNILENYQNMIVQDVVKGPRGQMAQEWAARQVYIALGNFMTAAALLGVDTCPMEGFEPEKYDEILNLTQSGFKSIVACAAGYRHGEDQYALAKKVRFPLHEMIERK